MIDPFTVARRGREPRPRARPAVTCTALAVALLLVLIGSVLESARADTFRDDFDAVSYAGNNGTQFWASTWREINESDGANASDERVIWDLGSLRLRVRDNDGGGEGVQRQADLSAYTSATLSFNYSRWPMYRATDYVTLAISDNGGASWTDLDRFVGPAFDPDYTFVTYDISAHLSANTRIRFLTSPWMLWASQVMFDNIEIDATASGPTIDHITIDVGSGSASTCAPQAVTITIEDASNNPVTDYVGTVTLLTSSLHGDWSANDANGTLVNGVADDGAATYAFVIADAGDVVLDLTNVHADDLVITVEDATASVSATSSLLGFAENAFVLAPTDSLGTEVVTGRDHGFQIEFWRKDPSTGLCAVEAGYAGSIGLKAWYTPDVSDPGGAAPVITGALPTSVPAGNNLTALFTAGVASFDLLTTDVGKYVLNLRDDTSAFAVDASGNPKAIDGSSATLTVRPFGLSLTGIVAGATANPGNDTATGPIFTSAGSDFEAVVSAVRWAAADDADNDGEPDSGADLSDNPAAASFAWTTTLSVAAPFEPAAGVLGALVNGSLVPGDFAAGAATAGTLQYPEVGSFTLGVDATGYLSTGGVDVAGEAKVVGRFVPFDLDVIVNAPMFAAGCAGGGFTYVGQPFTYVLSPVAAVTARAKNGAITRNYTSAYWKLTQAALTWPAGTDKGYASASNVLDTSLIVSPKPVIDDLGVSTGLNPGQGTLTFSAGGGLAFLRTVSLPPFDAEVALSINVIDDDGTAFAANPAKFGDASPAAGILFDTDKEQRYGRVRLDNAFGSDLLDLAVPMRIETVSLAGFFALDADDACTDNTLTLIDASPSDALDATTDTCVQDIGSPGLSGAGCAVAAPPGQRYTEPPAGGDFNLYLRAPGAGKVGSLDVVVDAPDWLEYDWNGAGDEDPVSRASFGQYKSQGSDFVILSREPLN